MAEFDNTIEETLYDYGGLLSCRHCGKSGLHWERDDSGRWRLADANCRIHSCPEYRPRDA